MCGSELKFKMERRRGFTLTELMIVITLIGVLAAIMFPVIGSVKARVGSVAWADQMRQVAMAHQMYSVDYDDYYVLARYSPDGSLPTGADRTWVQSLLPYVREFEMFVAPIDNTRDPNARVYDDDLLPGSSFGRYYSASMRSNIGYNFLIFAPMSRQGSVWNSQPRNSSMINSPSNVLMFAESAWEIKNGQPKGGGNYLIMPPCRYMLDEQGFPMDSFGMQGLPGAQIYKGNLAWVTHGEEPTVTGGLYPWYGQTLNMIFADGRAKALPMPSTYEGCDVQPDWNGYITDPDPYIWDNF